MANETMSVSRVSWRNDGKSAVTDLVDREWLLTNGLGGYSSGTISGAVTRRYHGLLIAALPNPLGRIMMFDHLSEQVRLDNGSAKSVSSEEREGRLSIEGTEYLKEFRLEMGLPVWTYEIDGHVFEKRIILAHRQNTVFISYCLCRGASLRLSLRPEVHFRPHDAQLSPVFGAPYRLSLMGDRFELSAPDPVLPTLRMQMFGNPSIFAFEPQRQERIAYRREQDRGYEALGALWSYGHFKVRLDSDRPVCLVASTEPWEKIAAITPEVAWECEWERRSRLIRSAPGAREDFTAAELVLAADQFLVTPAGRVGDSTRAEMQGEELRAVIAGYFWFTDWGRDTMISLEGLTLCTGRHHEARWILHAFGRYVRDGLIPNLFPEGKAEGLYHTADATLWFFHAIDRYLVHTGDRETIRLLLPQLTAIIAAHRKGTLFGIHMDQRDGLLVQGQEDYQLTWMDAKCDGWVVTPRRGKAVEINALWYNALVLMARWMESEGRAEDATEYSELAECVRTSFQTTFWYEEGRYLFDVVDESGAFRDHSLRPNQIFALSLPNPVLAPERWTSVLEAVTANLLTPKGLRSLAPGHPDFKASYHGDLRTRDAAYHQGTVWSWLIGPYVDAWIRVHPGRAAEARERLVGLQEHLAEACVGSISEVFDATPPYAARGCVAQAWGVAELLRTWQLTTPEVTEASPTEGP